MPISFNQITSNVAKVTFTCTIQEEETISELPVTVVYRPSVITEKIFAQLQSFDEMTGERTFDKLKLLNDLLVLLIKSWDVYKDNEHKVMFPIKAEQLAELPIMFLVQVLQAITGNLDPNQTAPKTN